MVVDLRYHLASLVAVFLSLGLGILIGTSLSGGEGLIRQEEWLASLERELEQIQIRRQETTVRLQELEKERDMYARFAASVSQTILSDALVDERAAIILMGSQSGDLEGMQQLFQNAGATISRLAHVKPGWNDRTDYFLTLLTPDGGANGGSAGVLSPGALLVDAVVGAGSEIFTTIDAPSLWLQARSSQPPTFVTFVLSESNPEYVSLFEQAHQELSKKNVPVAVVSAEAHEVWQSLAEERGIPYVTHASSPLGQVSLVHVVAHKEGGSYGHGQSLLPWPESLFPSDRATGVLEP